MLANKVQNNVEKHTCVFSREILLRYWNLYYQQKIVKKKTKQENYLWEIWRIFNSITNLIMQQFRKKNTIIWHAEQDYACTMYMHC